MELFKSISELIEVISPFGVYAVISYFFYESYIQRLRKVQGIRLKSINAQIVLYVIIMVLSVFLSTKIFAFLVMNATSLYICIPIQVIWILFLLFGKKLTMAIVVPWINTIVIFMGTLLFYPSIVTISTLENFADCQIPLLQFAAALISIIAICISGLNESKYRNKPEVEVSLKDGRGKKKGRLIYEDDIWLYLDDGDKLIRIMGSEVVTLEEVKN